MNVQTQEDVIKLRNEKPKHWVTLIKRHYPEIFQNAIDHNSLYNLNAANNSQLFFNWCTNIREVPKCPVTNLPLKFNTVKWEYRKFGKRGVYSDELIKRRCESRKKNTQTYFAKQKLKEIENGTYNILTRDVIHKRLHEWIQSTNFGGILTLLISRDKELLYNCIKYQRKLNLSKLSESVYCLYHDIEPKLCEITGKIARFKNFESGYYKYYTDPNDFKLIQEKRNLTLQERLKNSVDISDKDLKLLVTKIINAEYDKMSSNPNQYFLTNYSNIVPAILTRTAYLHEECKFTERLYQIYNNMWESPLNKFKKPAVFTTFINGYRLCENSYITSNIEIEMTEYIQSICNNVIKNSRKLLKNRMEIDAYIPDKKIAFELDGEYYHSDTFKSKTYHIDKTNVAESMGITMYHIWGNEWKYHKDIVKSMISNKLGKVSKLYARKCIVKNITKEQKARFLKENHIQGNDNSQFYVGLVHEDELVAVMTFGKRKITRNTSFELIRFCNKKFHTVVGGASKMFKYFIDNNPDINEITTYADRRWSSGKLYNILGFELSSKSKPNYWYFKQNKLFHRVSFQKHKLNGKLPIFDSSKTEYENMKNNGYHRVWDCGTYSFKWTRNNK